MSGTRPRTLYICYFGLREPLVQTQVLPYLREIGEAGIEVSLLTFEPEADRFRKGEIEQERLRLAEQGISWHWKKYHKRPSVPATLFDVLSGAHFAWCRVLAGEVDVIHARIHVPAAMAVLAKMFSWNRGPKILFDIRGFFPEEYTDAGVWKADGILYKTVKIIERWLLARSDGFVVLTEKARDILFPESAESGLEREGRPVEVIPCCVDSQRFEKVDEAVRTEMRSRLGVEGRKVVTYLGSFGGWYMTDEMLDFLAAARNRDDSCFALILTQSDSSEISSRLRDRGFGDGDFLVRKVPPEEVPAFLSAADFAISFIKPCFSKLSSSPTKMAEYFACGLPVVANRGVGDVAECIEAHRVGAMVEKFDAAEFDRAIDEIDELLRDDETRKRCKVAARSEFDLHEVGGVRYRRIYDRLLGSK